MFKIQDEQNLCADQLTRSRLARSSNSLLRTPSDHHQNEEADYHQRHTQE